VVNEFLGLPPADEVNPAQMPMVLEEPDETSS